MSVVLVIALVIGLAAWYSRYEYKKLWNKGKCPCGTSWELIDESDYGDLYVCPKCQANITLIYEVKYDQEK